MIQAVAMNWLAASIVASVVLTVVLNVVVRLWPGAAERSARRFDDWAESGAARRSGSDHGGPQVYIPWKAMLVASLVLTVVLNIVIRIL